MALTPLTILSDYKLVDKNQDIRGWSVKDAAGKEVGSIKEMLVDTDKDAVSFIVLDNEARIPVGEITIGDKVVLLGSAAPAQAVGLDQVLRLPVIQEQLQLTKHEVDRGGVRVQPRVTEEAVQQEVVLREEHVNLQRRTVNRSISPEEAGALKDVTVEVAEKAEVPVVSKQSRVVEEVVVRKTVDERSQTVQDTVRRSDVEVQEVEADGRSTSNR